MDIGFGALIDKFEQHVGVRATRALIFVIFVAVFAFCTRAIVDNLVSPMLTFFRTPVWGTTLIQIALMALSVGLGIALGAQALATFRQWKGIQETRRLLGEVEGLHKEVTDAGEQIVRNGREMSEQNQKLLRRLMAVLPGILEREAATDEDREKIRELMDELKNDLEDGDADGRLSDGTAQSSTVSK